MTGHPSYVAPALIHGSLPELPAGASVSAGPSFEEELSRLQSAYRVARGGERWPALRRLREAMHRELAEELR